jgi:LysR family transcriptional regulator, glycine cleavage system transcriptional activator
LIICNSEIRDMPPGDKSLRSLPSIKVLKAFESTARLGSTVRAGKELNVSHSAVSRHIQALEASLGVKLFERQGSGLSLTQSGRRVQVSITATFDALLCALDKERDAASKNRLLVSTTSSLALGWLLPCLPTFLAENPAVEVELIGTRDLADADRDEIDIVIRFGSGSWPVHALEPLCDDIVYPVCSPDFLRMHDGRVDFRELAPNLFLQDLDPILDWQEWLRSQSISVPKSLRGMRLHGGELSSEAARRGYGVALVRNLTVASDLAAGRLVRAHPGLTRVRDAVWIGGSRNSLHKDYVRRFREWLTREAAASTLGFD